MNHSTLNYGQDREPCYYCRGKNPSYFAKTVDGHFRCVNCKLVYRRDFKLVVSTENGMTKVELQNEITRLKEELSRVEKEEKKETAYDKYLKTYSGQELVKKYALASHGIWRVEGEDSNCDLGGSHHTPFLCYVEGTLRDVIRKAVDLKGFWTRGAGGRITKVEVTQI